jgi:predicted amidohydrolase
MKIAAVQMDVQIGQVAANLEQIAARLKEAVAQGAKLVIFPECAVTGYCFESLSEALAFAEPVPGPAIEAISRHCMELGCFAIFGLLERDNEQVYNTAVLTGPAGVIGSYRKVHLPFLGIDMFTTHGDRPFAVHEVEDLRVGMLICYDSAFPEASRALALAGADLIALPTNWPPGAECMADFTSNARAMENAVYFAAVNRVGTERGFPFIGKSRLCDPSGNTLADAPDTSETILYAEVDPARARKKHLVRVPGKHEINRMADRRPEMYGLLTKPHGLEPTRQTVRRV